MREKEEKAKKSGATLGKGTLLRKHNVDREDAALRAQRIGRRLAREVEPGQIEMVTKYAGDALVRAGYPAGVTQDAPAEMAGARG